MTFDIQDLIIAYGSAVIGAVVGFFLFALMGGKK